VSKEKPVMTNLPSLADLMADPGELSVSCLDCHHNTTMPVAALLPRYAAETPFPDVWGGFHCLAWVQAGGRSAELGGPPSGGADDPTVASGPADH
jgi:hypothetical protein